MSDLISRQAAIDEVNALTYPSSLVDVKRKLVGLPSIDAVPVVRCKDCKYHEDEENGMVYCSIPTGGWVDEDWFCADGERKES